MADDGAESLGRELQSLRLAQDMSGGATFVVDGQLKVVSAQGPDLFAAGFDPAALIGRDLEDILAADPSPTVLDAYRAALEGRETDLDFVDEVSGRLFHVEVRPLRGAGDVVVGAVARSDDRSWVESQQTHLEHVASMHVVGVCTYDVRSGWRQDDSAVRLLGLASASSSPETIIETVVVPEDRQEMALAWDRLKAQGGRATLTCRIAAEPGPDGSSVPERRIQSTLDVVLGSQGQLLRVVSTHVDVSAAWAAAAEVERAHQRVLSDRLDMVRDLSAVITRAALTVGDILQTVTDLAVAALGGGASFCELDADGSTVLRWAVSHRDPAAREVMVGWWDGPDGVASPVGSVPRRVAESGRPWLSSEDPEWRRHVGAEEPHPPLDALEHLMILPVHDRTRVVGLLAVLRSASDGPFGQGDLDLAQILADRAGAAVIADRALMAETEERDRRRAATVLLEDARSQRHRLVERLSATEARERRLLAEAVHDEPIQLIAAARLRLMALARRLDKERALDGDPGRPSTHDETARIGSILETAMERLRLLIVALSPHDLEDGLVAALSEVAEATFRGTETEVTCTGPESLPLTADQQASALLILREALVNVRQHALATLVGVHVRVEATQVVLQVVDDGVGSADIGPRKGHLGMVSMRARAEDAGGALAVESAVSVGTTITLTFPTSV